MKSKWSIIVKNYLVLVPIMDHFENYLFLRENRSQPPTFSWIVKNSPWSLCMNHFLLDIGWLYHIESLWMKNVLLTLMEKNNRHWDKFSMTTMSVHKKSIFLGIKRISVVLKVSKHPIFCCKNAICLIIVCLSELFIMKQKSDP